MMEMLMIVGVCIVTVIVAGLFGWQQTRQTNPGPLTIESPGPEGIPQRAPNLTGIEGGLF